MDIGRKLKELRAKAGLSQENVAESLYVSRQAVSKWENGEAFPEMENLVALSKFYNVSTDYLLSADEKNGINGKATSNERNAEHDSSAPSPKMATWQKKYTAARMSLAGVAIISIINYILYLCNVFTFNIPFGAGMPQHLLYYAMTYSGRNHAFQDMIDSIGDAYYTKIPDTLFYIVLIFTSILIISYAVCVICSGKYKREFLIIGLILWIIDIVYSLTATLISMLIIFLVGGSMPTFDYGFLFYLNWIWRIAFVVILIMGVSSANKIRRENKGIRKAL